AGVDRAGLPECVIRDAGPLPKDYRERTNYGRLPVHDELREASMRWCTQAPRPDPGTVLTIRWPNMPGPSDVAICTGATIIHAYRKSTGVVEHSYRGRWVRWTTAAWRVPGVMYE